MSDTDMPSPYGLEYRQLPVRYQTGPLQVSAPVVTSR